MDWIQKLTKEVRDEGYRGSQVIREVSRRNTKAVNERERAAGGDE